MRCDMSYHRDIRYVAQRDRDAGTWIAPPRSGRCVSAPITAASPGMGRCGRWRSGGPAVPGSDQQQPHALEVGLADRHRVRRGMDQVLTEAQCKRRRSSRFRSRRRPPRPRSPAVDVGKRPRRSLKSTSHRSRNTNGLSWSLKFDGLINLVTGPWVRPRVRATKRRICTLTENGVSVTEFMSFSNERVTWIDDERLGQVPRSRQPSGCKIVSCQRIDSIVPVAGEKVTARSCAQQTKSTGSFLSRRE